MPTPLGGAQDAAPPASPPGELDERAGARTLVVCGNGLTGVESAAEIAEQHPRLQVVLAGRQDPGAPGHRHPHPRSRRRSPGSLSNDLVGY
ncbi:MAG: hypothetical protein L0I76_34385 [Pseudonocardia sp.]|nr:hypothetical protein [Pseudonocardia sp.]